MANENPLPMAPPPGVCYSTSKYSLGKDIAYVGSGASAVRLGTGRWDSAQNMEFIAGFPQKIAGWVQAISAPFSGVPRAELLFRDAGGLARAVIGTTTHLYEWQAGGFGDITPATTVASGTLTNAISTTNLSALVAIADPAAVVSTNDWVFLSAASAVGGITLDGWYQVSNPVAGTGYNITNTYAATSTASAGGGSIAFQYPRINLVNPFTTTLGSAVVTVHHVNHNRSVGSFVDFGINTSQPISPMVTTGEYVVTGVVDANNYRITANFPANPVFVFTGGGGTVNVVYPIVVPQPLNSASPVWGQSGVNWGASGPWGTGGYAVAALADGWTLADYGSQMLCAPVGGTIYVWDSKLQGRAYPLLNAPPTVLSIFVTFERFVVALGINGNLMEMAWADQNDYTVWTTTPTNTALTGRTLSGGSYLVGGVTVRNGLSLIWSNECVFVMTYTAGQEIYSTEFGGDNCGLISPWAACVEGEIAYWMSDQDWWTYNGSPTSLPSDDVRASVYQAQANQNGINRTAMNKAVAVLNRTKKQVRFYFPSAIASENDGGMIFQFDSPSWSPLSFGRSAAVDAQLIPTPLSCDQNGWMYYDEQGVDANGAPLPCSISMSPLDVSDGAQAVDMFGFIPDFDYLTGTAMLEGLGSYYPDGPTASDGPWPIVSGTMRQDLRLDGRLFAFSLSLNGLGWTMRLGVNRLDIQTSGARV